MARLRYFLPMKPLGHKVSEMSSTGITSGCVLEVSQEVEAARRAMSFCAPESRGVKEADLWIMCRPSTNL